MENALPESIVFHKLYSQPIGLTERFKHWKGAVLLGGKIARAKLSVIRSITKH